jgi:hypothetical protein
LCLPNPPAGNLGGTHAIIRPHIKMLKIVKCTQFTVLYICLLVLLTLWCQK